jgi:hypothetical protein
LMVRCGPRIRPVAGASLTWPGCGVDGARPCGAWPDSLPER